MPSACFVFWQGAQRHGLDVANDPIPERDVVLLVDVEQLLVVSPAELARAGAFVPHTQPSSENCRTRSAVPLATISLNTSFV